ncbi:MAG: hypothetical protein CM15mP22_4970 [Gammaproteobacteria bacterium]|nr:MAG: hypothetical protein CM15mP22_4970 [Gammaproteobacteria bacterium]
MVTSGSDSDDQASPELVAERTIQCLKDNVPNNLPYSLFIRRPNRS